MKLALDKLVKKLEKEWNLLKLKNDIR
jgi:hypothetical protein